MCKLAKVFKVMPYLRCAQADDKGGTEIVSPQQCCEKSFTVCLSAELFLSMPFHVKETKSCFHLSPYSYLRIYGGAVRRLETQHEHSEQEHFDAAGFLAY